MVDFWWSTFGGRLLVVDFWWSTFGGHFGGRLLVVDFWWSTFGGRLFVVDFWWSTLVKVTCLPHENVIPL